jgi:hypothetical protein
LETRCATPQPPPPLLVFTELKQAGPHLHDRDDVKIVLAVVGIEPQPSTPYPVTVQSCHLVPRLRMHGNIFLRLQGVILGDNLLRSRIWKQKRKPPRKTIWKMTA